jgi:hypothetical protein
MEWATIPQWFVSITKDWTISEYLLPTVLVLRTQSRRLLLP